MKIARNILRRMNCAKKRGASEHLSSSTFGVRSVFELLNDQVGYRLRLVIVPIFPASKSMFLAISR